jgi:hypothetical protein
MSVDRKRYQATAIFGGLQWTVARARGYYDWRATPALSADPPPESTPAARVQECCQFTEPVPNLGHALPRRLAPLMPMLYRRRDARKIAWRAMILS